MGLTTSVILENGNIVSATFKNPDTGWSSKAYRAYDLTLLGGDYTTKDGCVEDGGNPWIGLARMCSAFSGLSVDASDPTVF